MPTTELDRIDVTKAIDAASVGRLQILVFTLCAAIALIDGFDTQAIAFVAPSISEQWKVSPAAFGSRDPDFVIIARTDARSVAGFDEAIRRANAAMEAGADLAFVESLQTLEEVQMVPLRVRGPCLLNVVWGGKTPQARGDDPRWRREEFLNDRFWRILLKKSFLGDARNYLEPLMRFARGDVRDLIVSHKIDQEPLYLRHEALQR